LRRCQYEQSHLTCNIREEEDDFKMMSPVWEEKLYEAVRQNKLGSVRAILAANSVTGLWHLRRKIWKNESPLFWAVVEGNRDDMVKVFVAAGCRPNSYIEHDGGDRYTALHFAAVGNHVSTVKLLLELGADATLEGVFGFNSGTPTDWARAKGHVGVVSVLGEHLQG
jgi:hypothetical protein